MLARPNETITWVDAEERLPKPWQLVLIFAPDQRTMPLVGFCRSEKWWLYDGRPVTRRVVAWAEMPQGPGKNETNNEGE